MVLWVIVILLAALGWLIAPAFPRCGLDSRARVPYAHRGLWDDALPENSLPAFIRAAEHGFGIELDVHLTRDNQLAVIHDDDLDRMCPDAPRGLRVQDCTMAKLKRYHLLDTDYTIPDLREVLAALRGRCPLIIELKTGPRNSVLCARVCEAVQMYGMGAAWCVESFDPRMMAWFRRHKREVIRGQLACGAEHISQGKHRFLRGLAMRMLLGNVLSRPDFIAWEHHCDSVCLRIVRALFHPCTVAWVVRDQQTMDRLAGRYDLQIFEGFIPRGAVAPAATPEKPQ